MMINTIYKPKRSRIWRWKFRLRPEDGAIEDVSLGTSDKQVAEKFRGERLREKEHERAGLIPPKAARDAAQRKLADHLEDFLGDMRRRGKSEKYLANLEFRVERLISDCGWSTAKDASADSFQAWLRGQLELKDKTANDYLEAARCFFNWLVKLGRAGSNPLLSVEKVKTKGGSADEVRAFSDDEVLRLLAVAGDRKPVYLMAVHTGLRRSEVAALKWSDLTLDAVTPFVQVRASTTKNGKSAAMRLHPELAAALAELKTEGTQGDELVFKGLPRIERFYRDLKKAGIPLRDASGRKAVFHSLRHTFGTNLARGGVASRVAMALMRHSDRRLTDKIYTDENLLGTWAAFDSLPNYGERASQGASQILGASGQTVALVGTAGSVAEVAQTPVNIGDCHVLALPGTTGQNAGDGGSGGARTCNPPVNPDAQSSNGGPSSDAAARQKDARWQLGRARRPGWAGSPERATRALPFWRTAGVWPASTLVVKLARERLGIRTLARSETGQAARRG
jgi:integrase